MCAKNGFLLIWGRVYVCVFFFQFGRKKEATAMNARNVSVH